MSQNDSTQNPNNLAAFCWSIADLLRGDFKQSQYGRIILPFTLLRRLEGVLADSKEQVLAELERIQTMGLTFEELIRRFAEGSNETAGEHFTPRDIVRLTTSLVFMEDDNALTKSGIIRTIYDPTAGTGGFLSSVKHLILLL